MAVDEEESHYWIVAGVIVGIFFLIIALLSWALHWRWLPNLWFNYAWSSDKGNGPEAIQQTIVYAVAAVILIPRENIQCSIIFPIGGSYLESLPFQTLKR